jgi:hypothetical protein
MSEEHAAGQKIIAGLREFVAAIDADHRYAAALRTADQFRRVSIRWHAKAAGRAATIRRLMAEDERSSSEEGE